MNTELMFSSKSDERETPKDLYDELNTKYNFVLDAAATKENALCPLFFTKEDDALVKDWSPLLSNSCSSPSYWNIWLNPPYSQLGVWIEKAYNEAKKGCIVVMLIPARTDTRAFHQYIYPYSGIEYERPAEGVQAYLRFLKGRLRFSGSKNSAPFSSMLVTFSNSL